MLAQLQYFVLIFIGVASFACQVVALANALRQPPHAFTSEGKLTRTKWLVILVIATLLGFLALPFPGYLSPLSFLNIIAAVAAIVYLVDVRPAVAGYRRRRGNGNQQRW